MYDRRSSFEYAAGKIFNIMNFFALRVFEGSTQRAYRSIWPLKESILTVAAYYEQLDLTEIRVPTNQMHYPRDLPREIPHSAPPGG